MRTVCSRTCRFRSNVGYGRDSRAACRRLVPAPRTRFRVVLSTARKLSYPRSTRSSTSRRNGRACRSLSIVIEYPGGR